MGSCWTSWTLYISLLFAILPFGKLQEGEGPPLPRRSEFVSSLFLKGPSLEVRGEDPNPRFSPTVRLRMSESCLACLCAASTDCQLSKGCVGGGEYCGPFLISKPYWLDAGTPVLLGDDAEREGAFEDCAMDPICSAQAVRRYMTRFQKDCNGDGVVDCGDLALIHLMGPYGTQCGNPAAEATSYFRKFSHCWESVLRLSPTSPPFSPAAVNPFQSN